MFVGSPEGNPARLPSWAKVGHFDRDGLDAQVAAGTAPGRARDIVGGHGGEPTFDRRHARSAATLAAPASMATLHWAKASARTCS